MAIGLTGHRGALVVSLVDLVIELKLDFVIILPQMLVVEIAVPQTLTQQLRRVFLTLVQLVSNFTI